MITTTNGVSFANLEAAATQLGAEAGTGKDTQVKMLMLLAEGGYHSSVDIVRDKHGDTVDDATKLAEAYVKAQGSASVFDAKAPNQRKLVACFRTMIKFGQYPKGGVGEPLATMNKLMSIRQKLRQKPSEAKKLDDAANTLLKYARLQLRSDTLIDEDQLSGFCYRKTPELMTAEEHVEACRKHLRKLFDGKASGNTALDNSKHVKDAIQSLTKRLEEIAGGRSARQAAYGQNTQSTFVVVPPAT